MKKVDKFQYVANQVTKARGAISDPDYLSWIINHYLPSVYNISPREIKFIDFASKKIIVTCKGNYYGTVVMINEEELKKLYKGH